MTGGAPKSDIVVLDGDEALSSSSRNDGNEGEE